MDGRRTGASCTAWPALRLSATRRGHFSMAGDRNTTEWIS
jgi:hypothetical protein